MCLLYVYLYEPFCCQSLHPVIKDAESRQIWHFVTMPGVEHCNVDYNVGCSGTPYILLYVFSSSNKPTQEA
jgi:hypothetical protein